MNISRYSQENLDQLELLTQPVLYKCSTVTLTLLYLSSPNEHLRMLTDYVSDKQLPVCMHLEILQQKLYNKLHSAFIHRIDKARVALWFVYKFIIMS